jgi:hypothetical protein
MSQQPPNYPPNDGQQPPYQGGPYQPQQPGQYPPQGYPPQQQYPPQGYQPGQWQGQPPPGYPIPPQQQYQPQMPPPKRGMPGWAWGLIGFIVFGLVIIGIIGVVSSNRTTATTTPTVQAAVQPTNAAVARATPTSVYANDPTVQAVRPTLAPRPTITPRSASTAVAAVPVPTTVAAAVPAPTTVAAVVPNSTGPGSELVGQLIAVGDSDVRVKSVTQFTELKGSSKTATPKGVFMVIVFDVANLGTKPSALSFLNLKDGQNRQFAQTTDSDAIVAIATMPQFKEDLLINPGFVGTEVKTYDVPKDATGFKIEADSFAGNSKGRKPSAESFSTSGGKGPDSGAGKELVGKTFTTKEKVTATVTAVDRMGEVKAGSKSFKSNGVYVIVQYDVTNNGDKPSSFVTFYLKDSNGHFFSTSSDFDLAFELGTSGNYKQDFTINPGQSGKGYKVFEVTKEATGFEMVASYF